MTTDAGHRDAPRKEARRGASIGVALPAAGFGRRMGGRRKPWLVLAGEPVLAHALRPFLERSDVSAIRVALAPDEASAPPDWLVDLDPRIEVVAGGATRARSVREAIRELPEVDLIAVHDAARPLVTGGTLQRLLESLEEDLTGVVAGWPATDTLKVVGEGERIVRTPDRSTLWHAQTPQLFRAAALRRAYEELEAIEEVGRVTDDASLLEAAGYPVRMVEGSPVNLKVTRPGDLPVAELLLRRRREGA